MFLYRTVSIPNRFFSDHRKAADFIAKEIKAGNFLPEYAFSKVSRAKAWQILEVYDGVANCFTACGIACCISTCTKTILLIERIKVED